MSSESMTHRLIIPRVLLLLIVVALIGRLFQVQFVISQPEQARSEADNLVTRYVPLAPLRGQIYASDGKTVLAATVPIYTISIRPADLPPAKSQERSAMFAQLAALLGQSGTVVVSPTAALDTQPGLHAALTITLGSTAMAQAVTERASPVLRMTVGAAQSVGAADLARRYRDNLQFDPMVVDGPAGASVPIPQITGTLTISPGMALVQNQTLRNDLRALLGQPALDAAGVPRIDSWTTIAVAPHRALDMLQLSERYSTTLQLKNPLQRAVERSGIAGYQTLPIASDVPRDVALVLRENAPSLPGVVVEQDFRRSYPLSATIPSISHTLGYIGRVNQCELVRENSARSWVAGLFDSVGNAVECGIIQKQINPYQLGMPTYLTDDRIGKDGVEASYETELRGKLGVDALMVDALGRPMRNPQEVQATRDGSSLVLTIDVGFQRQVEGILQNWIDEADRRRQNMPENGAYKRNYKPIKSGVAIIFDVRTGRILASASLPAYDNNLWLPARSSELVQFFPTAPDAQLEMARLAPLTNRAVAGQYPPGSTLKQFDGSIALEKGVITADTLVRDPGRLVLADQFVKGRTYTYPNSTPRDNGMINVSDALMRSSNVFFMSIAGGNKEDVINLKDDEKTLPRGLDIGGLADGLSNWFGFGALTGVRLAGEATGRVPTPAWKQQVQRAAWTTGDTYNAAIGQGNLEVTPLQLVSAGAAIANDGSLFRPQIVQSIVGPDGVAKPVSPELIRRVPVTSQHLTTIREGMRRSVTEGLNIAARDDCSGLAIAGKTGTAEFGASITVPTIDGKSTRTVRQSHAWFTGFAPYDNPQIEVLVLIEGAGDLNDGSSTLAVPAATQIMQAYFGTQGPSPLPRGCQKDMPPLPARIGSGALMQPFVPGPADR